MINAFHYFAGFAPEACEDALLLDHADIHMEFLMTFIQNNNYPTKEQWVESFRYEYTYAGTVKLFPRELIVVLAKVLRELKNNLTLEQILEIKKLMR